MNKVERNEIRELIGDFNTLNWRTAERCLDWGEMLLGLLREISGDSGCQDLHPGLLKRVKAAIAEADGPQGDPA